MLASRDSKTDSWVHCTMAWRRESIHSKCWGTLTAHLPIAKGMCRVRWGAWFEASLEKQLFVLCLSDRRRSLFGVSQLETKSNSCKDSYQSVKEQPFHDMAAAWPLPDPPARSWPEQRLFPENSFRDCLTGPSLPHGPGGLVPGKGHCLAPGQHVKHFPFICGRSHPSTPIILPCTTDSLGLSRKAGNTYVILLLIWTSTGPRM